MLKKTIIVVLAFIIIALIPFINAYSQECDIDSPFPANQEDLSRCIENLKGKVSQLKEQSSSLSSQIQYMNTQIYLTSLKIQETEDNIKKTQEEIGTLTSRIEGLDTSLDYLSELLLNKIVAGYKKRTVSYFTLFLDSQNGFDLLNRIKYLKTAQDSNQRLLVQVQEIKLNFEEQKKLREEKKIQLDKLSETLAVQKASLDNQKLAKQRLLDETQNSEQKYQQLLEMAQAEYAAIQGIINNQGDEIEVRNVSRGDVIAHVIPGPSCNSSGGHLHFMVKENNNVNNPFSYLKSVDYTNCSSSSCGSGDGDPFNPSGNWDWPLNPAIELDQGYGSTWAVRNTWVSRIYSFHNGIDINGSSNDVKAVSDGILYKGGYAGSGGCTLPYVMLKHKDSNIFTYYLHVLIW